MPILVAFSIFLSGIGIFVPWPMVGVVVALRLLFEPDEYGLDAIDKSRTDDPRDQIRAVVEHRLLHPVVGAGAKLDTSTRRSDVATICQHS